MANMYSSLFAARAQLQLPQHIACTNSTFRRASFCPRWTIQTNRPLVTAASAPAPVPGITEIVDTPSLPSRIDSIPPEKLKTLRRLGLEMKDVIKIGRLGVGKGIIQQINNRWQTSEVAKLYCGGKAGTNMKLMATALERETGGIVIHRSGGSVYLYKGDTN
ncbi:hypothetical protein Ndes2526B_g07885 [Nannochloris sp. 'desiccata']